MGKHRVNETGKNMSWRVIDEQIEHMTVPLVDEKP